MQILGPYPRPFWIRTLDIGPRNLDCYMCFRESARSVRSWFKSLTTWQLDHWLDLQNNLRVWLGSKMAVFPDMTRGLATWRHVSEGLGCYSWPHCCWQWFSFYHKLSRHCQQTSSEIRYIQCVFCLLESVTKVWRWHSEACLCGLFGSMRLSIIIHNCHDAWSQ